VSWFDWAAVDRVIDTAAGVVDDSGLDEVKAGEVVEVVGRALVVLKRKD
jgi:hypothetical protein